jgi:Uma2 family endonuclease
MSAAAPVTTYLETIETLPPNSSISLRDVSWEEYERILVALDERPWLRVTYDQGKLEIMTLSPEHENPARIFTHLISVLAEATGVDFLCFGSTTLRLEKISGGLEPDDCYYIGDFSAVAGIKKMDLNLSPPPDLAVEIDISHESLRKFHIYAGLKVKELWRYDGSQIEFYRLTEDRYEAIETSDQFPFLPPRVLPDFITVGQTQGIIAMRRAFGEWVRERQGDK